jgi:LAO/AO transport system kinase
MKANGLWKKNRQEQSINWMHDYIKQYLVSQFFNVKKVKENYETITNLVLSEKILPIQGANLLLEKHFASLSTSWF